MIGLLQQLRKYKAAKLGQLLVPTHRGHNGRSNPRLLLLLLLLFKTIHIHIVYVHSLLFLCFMVTPNDIQFQHFRG